MKRIVVVMLGLLFIFGCARVRVEVPREPIKVDISMRLDIYQHVQKDIDAIEDIVSGARKEDAPPGGESLLNYVTSYAYAQEGLKSEVEEAALRRRDRYSEVTLWQERGAVGEDSQGLLQIRASSGTGSSLEALVEAENNDRMIIYCSLAEKNNVSIEEIQTLYAQRLQKGAPRGTPVEVLNEVTGDYEWRVK